MKAVVLVVLTLTLMAGDCMPIVAGTAALQGVQVFVNPIADALGTNIAQLISNAFLPLYDLGEEAAGG